MTSLQYSRHCSFIGIASALLLVSLPAGAAAQAVDDTGVWLALFSQGAFKTTVPTPHESLWWFDAHVRRSGDEFDFFQGIIRPGIGRRLDDRNSVWAGYAWIGESIPDLDFHENRSWQQWIHTNDRGRASIVWRSRLEQRFVSVGAQVGWRFRQMVRLQKSMNAESTLSFVAWDEIFFHLRDTDWGAQTGYNQNRVFVGLGRSPKDRGARRVEIGYLYQQIDVAEDGADLNNHVLSLNLYWQP